MKKIDLKSLQDKSSNFWASFKKPDSVESRGAIIDWFTFTYLPPLKDKDEDTIKSIMRYFKLFYAAPVSIVPAKQGEGFRSFKENYSIQAWVEGEFLQIGTYSIGSEAQKFVHCFNLFGRGCPLVNDWKAFYAMLQDLDARISRCDLAVDFLEGEVSIDDMESLYLEGAFNSGGRFPSRLAISSGNHLDPIAGGRTLTLGKRENGKQLRAYEKGKQLKIDGSNWVRVEVQLGNRDRVIPHDVVFAPTDYFAGSHKALALLVNRKSSKKIATYQKVVDSSIEHSMHWLKRHYGKTINVLVKHVFKEDYSAFVQEIRVTELNAQHAPIAFQDYVLGRDDTRPFFKEY